MKMGGDSINREAAKIVREMMKERVTGWDLSVFFLFKQEDQ